MTKNASRASLLIPNVASRRASRVLGTYSRITGTYRLLFVVHLAEGWGHDRLRPGRRPREISLTDRWSGWRGIGRGVVDEWRRFGDGSSGTMVSDKGLDVLWDIKTFQRQSDRFTRLCNAESKVPELVEMTYLVFVHTDGRDRVCIRPHVVLEEFDTILLDILASITKVLPLLIPSGDCLCKGEGKVLVIPLVGFYCPLSTLKLDGNFVELASLDERLLGSEGVDAMAILFVTVFSLCNVALVHLFRLVRLFNRVLILGNRLVSMYGPQALVTGVPFSCGEPPWRGIRWQEPRVPCVSR